MGTDNSKDFQQLIPFRRKSWLLQVGISSSFCATVSELLLAHDF